MIEEGEEINWPCVIEEWRLSGLTQSKFCKHKQINRNHFTYQKMKYLKKSSELTESIAFAPVKVIPDAFPTDTRQALTIQSNRGFIITLPAEKSLLQMVLNVLGEG